MEILHRFRRFADHHLFDRVVLLSRDQGYTLEEMAVISDGDRAEVPEVTDTARKVAAATGIGQDWTRDGAYRNFAHAEPWLVERSDREYSPNLDPGV